MWKFFLLILLVFFSSYANSFSFENTVSDSLYYSNDNQAEKKPVLDSLSSDTTNQVTKDTVQLFTANKKTGSLGIIEKRAPISEIVKINYYTLNEIILDKNNFYPFLTGVAGNSNSFSVLGALPTNNKLLLSNSPINNLFYSGANFNAFSPEFVGNLEILTGSKAVIFEGVPGAVVNLKPPIYNTAKPYTRIWYNQGANKHIGLDGIFSQNFLPNWNLTAGFRSMFSNGSYENSNIKSWNARIAIRNNLSDLSTIAIIYNFTNYYSGDFGGINFTDFENNNFESASLVKTNFSGLASRQYRNDITLTYATQNSDSSFIMTNNIFFTNEENNIIWENEDKILAIDSSGKNTVNGQLIGAKTNLSYNFFKVFTLYSGAEFAFANIPKTIIYNDISGFNYNVFSYINYGINYFSLSFGGRYENKFNENLLALASKINIDLGKNYSLFLDVSSSNFMPLPMYNFEKEKHFLSILGTEIKQKTIDLDINLFYRKIENPLLIKFDKDNYDKLEIDRANIQQKNIFGLNANINFVLAEKIILRAKSQVYLDDYREKELSAYILFSSAYRYQKGENVITAGISGAMQANTELHYYHPLLKLYSHSNLINKFNFDGLSVFITAKIANAFIRASLNNILGLNYSLLAYYPIQPRELCLSLTWTLL